MNTFRKQEKLKSKKLIDQLFEKSKAITVSPLKLVWTPVAGETDAPVQAGFSVPKRLFPKAVDRNRIKRLMREAWRLQKQQLYTILKEKNLQLAMMILFTGKQIPEYKEVFEKVTAIIQQLEKSL